MNKVSLTGNLARDPQVRYGTRQDGQPYTIAMYTIAVSRQKTQANPNPGADFIDLRAFGKTAEFVEKYLHKGSRILVEGSLVTDNYQDKEGKNVYRTYVRVHNHEFIGTNPNAQNAGQNAGTANAGMTPNNAYNAYQAPAADPNLGVDPNYGYGEMDANGFMSIPDEVPGGIPFN